MSRATAIERVREAQTDWDKAIRAHEQVMPELGPFAARLRETSHAAAKQAAAFEYAAEAGLRALAKDTVVRHPPRELSPEREPPRRPTDLGAVRRRRPPMAGRMAERLHHNRGASTPSACDPDRNAGRRDRRATSQHDEHRT